MGSKLPGYTIAFLWYAAGVVAIAFAGIAFVPPRVALEFIRTTGYAWIYALITAVVAWRLVVNFQLWNGVVWNPAIDLSWKPAADVTFSLVNSLLHLFTSQVVADRSTMTIGSPTFSAVILPWCAGLRAPR